LARGPERRQEEAMARPIVGITMGDAAGIGPEIIMKGLARARCTTSAGPW